MFVRFSRGRAPGELRVGALLEVRGGRRESLAVGSMRVELLDAPFEARVVVDDASAEKKEFFFADDRLRGKVVQSHSDDSVSRGVRVRVRALTISRRTLCVCGVPGKQEKMVCDQKERTIAFWGAETARAAMRDAV